jgi:hypothetical protein
MILLKSQHFVYCEVYLLDDILDRSLIAILKASSCDDVLFLPNNDGVTIMVGILTSECRKMVFDTYRKLSLRPSKPSDAPFLRAFQTGESSFHLRA